MKTCIVGAGSSLAQPLIDRLSAGRHEIVAVCRNAPPELKSESGRYGVVLGADMADDDQARRAFSGVSGLDAMVVMTGATADARVERMAEGDWDAVQNSVLKCAFHALKHGLPKMAEGGGNVVLVGSVVGSAGGYGCANYAAAKAGLVGLARGAANEWAARGVRVNVLELGYTSLGMGARLPPEVAERARKSIPLGRFADADDFLLACEFLMKTRYCTGNVLTLAGGMRGHG